MASATMADHKLISTPVSVADGLKRGDKRTWLTLLVAGAVAVVIVIAVNLFVEKPAPVRWPAAKPAGAGADEPRTYEVAPPGPPAAPSED